MEKITVKGIDVSVKKINEEDYISLTDMLKAKEGEFFVKSWLRNRNTVEFIGIWESVHNTNFNWYEFDLIKKDAGLNNFNMSVEEWIKRTNAIGFTASRGRYGGTYAHKDIAFEFGMWISPEFKIYLIKEFQRLKEIEQKLIGWSAKRELAKINYRIHTDAIKENLVIPAELTAKECSFVYADEADILNVALFQTTAKAWRDANPDKDGNIRDYATLEQLLVLANLESLNAEFIRMGLNVQERVGKLNAAAISQMKSLAENKTAKRLENWSEQELLKVVKSKKNK